MNKAILLMAHGAPADLEKVEEYILHVRGGHPLAPEQMATIKDRYRQVGGSPLLQITSQQAAALQNNVNIPVYVGMRHSPPFIRETIAQMISEGLEDVVAICLAPQFSHLTIGAYRKELEEAIQGRALKYSFVTSYARHPQLIDAFAQRLRGRDAETFVIFTAHSLPARAGQADPYDYEVKETARLVANAAGLKDWRFAYQSQGMRAEPWLGPTVESVIDALALKNVRKILIVPIGFVSDNVEILYDIDVHFRNYAAEKGIELTRSPSLNDSPAFIALLAALVRERL